VSRGPLTFNGKAAAASPRGVWRFRSAGAIRQAGANGQEVTP
jgi:hypothetical protein